MSSSRAAVTLEGDDITKVLSKLEANLKAKSDGNGGAVDKDSPEPAGVLPARAQPLSAFSVREIDLVDEMHSTSMRMRSTLRLPVGCRLHARLRT